MHHPYHKMSDDHHHPWRDALGRPGEGIHSYRFLGIAAVDAIMTIAAAVGVAWYMGWNIPYTIVGMFVLGAIVHRAFGVNTAANVFLFGKIE